MIKTAVKNFFRSLLYLFVPMGIFYLFLLIAIFGFAASAVGSAGTMIGSLVQLIDSTVTDSGISVSEFFAYAAEEIVWDGNIFSTIAQILDTDWIGRTVRGFFELLNDSSVTFSGEFTEVITGFAGEIKLQFGLAVTTVTLGLFLANFATRVVLRRKSAPRGIKKWLVANTLVPVVHFLLLVVLAVLAALIQYYTIIVAVVCLVGSAVLSLISSWLIHGRDVPLSHVVNSRNVLTNLLSVVCVWGIVVAIALLVLIFNPVVAVLVLLPLAVYALNIISVNNDAYVYDLAQAAAARAAEEGSEGAEAAPREEPAAEEQG